MAEDATTDDLTQSAIAYVEGLLAGDVSGHDTGHAIRVWHNAMAIADSEPTCDREVVALAALLHDVDDYKLFDTEDNANARAFLVREGVDADDVGRICEAIDAVSFSRNRDSRPSTIEGAIVRDADRLDAIGAIGVARTFMFGGARQVPMDGCVRHFHEKLLLLAGMMRTDRGAGDGSRAPCVPPRLPR